MVRVEVVYKGNDIVGILVEGHANYSVHGQDIVCAGVSSICVGTLNAINEMCENSCELKMNEAYVKIKVLENSNELQIILNTTMIQLHTIAESNSEYIKITKEEV